MKGAAGNLGAEELMVFCATLEAKGREETFTNEDLREMEFGFTDAARDTNRFVASISADLPNQHPIA